MRHSAEFYVHTVNRHNSFLRQVIDLLRSDGENPEEHQFLRYVENRQLGFLDLSSISTNGSL